MRELHRILVAELLWIAPLVGLGFISLQLIGRLLRQKFKPKETSFAELGLLGLVTIGGLGSALNFAVPLRLAAFPVFVIGWISFVHGMKKRTIALIPWKILIPSVALSVGSTYFAIPVYDSGQYHLPTSMWAYSRVFPIGYGHLNEFIGYNSGWDVVGAMLMLPGIGLDTFYVGDSIAILLCFLSLVSTIVTNDEKTSNHTRLFAGALLVAVTILNLPANGGANGTDSPAAVFAISCFLYLFRLSEMDWRRAALATVFATFAFTSKLSQLPILVGALAIVFFKQGGFRAPAAAKRKVLMLGVLVLGLILPWVGRGLLGTGCVAYPAGSSCLTSLPWAVPRSQADAQALDIKSSAGSCWIKEGAGNRVTCFTQEWIPFLLKTREFQFVLVALLVTLVFVLAAYRRDRRTWQKIQFATPAIATAVGSLVFWFFTAPTPRFSIGSFCVLGGLLLALAAIVAPGTEKLLRFRGWALTLLFLFVAKRVFLLTLHEDPFGRTSHFPRTTHAREVAQVSQNGATYYTSSNIRCENIRPPCAIGARPDLIIREDVTGRLHFSRQK